MLCSTLQREDRCRKITVLIIVLIWVIMTIRTGPDWLTPMEIAFCALLLGQPTPNHRSISANGLMTHELTCRRLKARSQKRRQYEAKSQETSDTGYGQAKARVMT
jgi:hypothetical protein